MRIVVVHDGSPDGASFDLAVDTERVLEEEGLGRLTPRPVVSPLGSRTATNVVSPLTLATTVTA